MIQEGMERSDFLVYMILEMNEEFKDILCFRRVFDESDLDMIRSVEDPYFMHYFLQSYTCHEGKDCFV